MGRSPCCAKEGLNRGAWTAMEDKILIEYIKVHGEGRWRNLPKRAGLKRCGKSCRLRWLNYLRPDIKRGNITPDEEELIIRLHKLLGNRWSLIAGRLPGRTDNEIKNYWNANLGKRVNQQKSQANNNIISNSSKHQKKSRSDRKNKKVLQVPNNESNVVRTKAVRCTKVYIKPPQPQQQSQSQPQLSDDVNNINIIRSDDENMVSQPRSLMMVDNYNKVDSSSIDHESSIGMLEEENSMISDYMVDDLNVGDFNIISELLNSEFSGFYDDFGGNESSSNNNNNDGNDLSSSPNCSEHQFVFSQELLEDWLGDRRF